MNGTARDVQAFRIPRGEHLVSNFLHATRGFWRRMGSIEAHVMRERLDAIAIDRPIYIAGLARSGSTILLETIAAHDDVATHRYRDFWSIFTPVWAARAYHRMPRAELPPVERAHGDGIMITPDSPEAIEEMLWMEFFQDLHDPTVSNVLGPETEHPAFERYYRDHLRKLLLVRNARRYATKANYNLTRLRYLCRLFPDARFVLPIREPRDHVASLRKQHRLLMKAAETHPRSVCYLDRVGHFEFGAHRTPINAGDSTTVDRMLALWREGHEVRGWALYWSHLYEFAADQLAADDTLREATLVVRYGDLCGDSDATVERLFAHCRLETHGQLVERCAARLRRPEYYRPEFTGSEERAIEEETAAVAERFGLAPLADSRREPGQRTHAENPGAF